MHDKGDFDSAERLLAQKAEASTRFEQLPRRVVSSAYGHSNQQINIAVWLQAAIHLRSRQRTASNVDSRWRSMTLSTSDSWFEISTAYRFPHDAQRAR